MTAGSGEALRQQLRAAMREVWHRIDCGGTEACFLDCDEDAALVNDAIWPLVDAVLAAARVATATGIAEAIYAESARQLDPDVSPRWHDGMTDAASIASIMARKIAAGGSVPAPKGDQ